MRRASGTTRRNPWGRGGLAATLLAVALMASRWWQQGSPPPGPIEPGAAKVERVVDGDTLLMASGTRIRLIGVNTPETVKANSAVERWGPEASAFTKQFLAEGEVRLQFDRERTDRFGRTLAYVWVGQRMLNEELIRAGLAHAEMQYSYSAEMKDRFSRAESEARKARRGLWSGA